MLQILFIALCLLHAGFGVPITYSPNLLVCQDVKCIRDFRSYVIRNANIAAVIITFNFKDDTLLAMQGGWLLYLFEYTGLDIKVLISDINCSREFVCDHKKNDFFLEVLKMPSKTIFVSFQHSNGFHPGILASDRIKHGLKIPGIFLHLNHEQPWSRNLSDYRNNKFGTIEEVSKHYKAYPLVLRNYYYAPLSKLSHFIPLGPAYYGMYIGGELFPNSSMSKKNIQERQNILNIKHKLASKRRILCSLRGRFAYEDYSPYHKERMDIAVMVAKGIFPCSVSHSGQNRVVYAPELEDYAAVLNETVFAPCPGGNNPETFRHYEVHCETE